MATIGLYPNLPTLRIVLPVGISFFTFQAMSYTIDIYRGKLEPTKSFIDFALFKAFFPQLVAGPIERASNLGPQISSARHVTHEDVLTGLNLVLLGHFFKVAIADSLAPVVENIFGTRRAYQWAIVDRGLCIYFSDIWRFFWLHGHCTWYCTDARL